MNSRNRVLETLSHKTPDRVPIDFNCHRSSGIAVQTYKRLREFLGLKPSALYIYDVLQQLAIVEDDVLDYFGVDVVQLGYEYYKQPNYWQDWTLHDGTQCKIPGFIKINRLSDGNYSINADDGQQICLQKSDCLYFEQTHFPLENSDDREFNNLENYLEKVMWVKIGTPPTPSTIKQIGRNAADLRTTSDRAIYATFGGNLLELGQQSFRMDNFLLNLAMDPDRVHTFLDRLLDLHMKNLSRFIYEVGPHVDIIGFGDDLGTQTGPQMSVDMFCEFFKPRYGKMWRYIKKNAPHLKICMHSCGSIYDLIPHLIDAGLDAVNPVQTTCRNMEPEKLKREFGNDLTFWGGGCDTRTVLPFGTTMEVVEDVKKNIDSFSGSGGFVFQQIHNILADVPVENIVAMFDAVKKYGKC